MKVDELVVVDVDLNIAPQCEHGRHHEPDWHGGDAKYLIQGTCGLCGPRPRRLLCGPAWVEFNHPKVDVFCDTCGGLDVVLRVVSVL